MKPFKEIAGVSALDFWEYNAKCIVGVTIGYLLYKGFPQDSWLFLWVLISILLSITHDNNSQVAYDRMKGNVVGSAVGLIVFLLHNPSNLLTLCIGVVAVVCVCFKLKLIGVSRTALVAFIIVMFNEESLSSWKGAIYRVIGVISGCLVGLIINHVFRKLVNAIYRPSAPPASDKIAREAKPDGGE